MNSEPTLSDVHADLVARLKQDERIRSVEMSVAALQTLPAELVRMEDRIMAGIAQVAESSKPRSPWPAVSAIAGALAVVLVLAAAIYGQA